MNVKGAYLFFSVFALSLFSCQNQQLYSNNGNKRTVDPWSSMVSIIEGMETPSISSTKFNVIDYGADCNFVQSSTLAITEAIRSCNEAGGGQVIVPKGTYKSGPIHLLSNVNLHLEEGATILFSTAPKDYLPLVNTSFEGIELYNYSPLIYANNQSNIAITGSGTLDGQANNDNWWSWKGSEIYGWDKGGPSQLDSLNLPALVKMAEDGVEVSERQFGEGHFLRPAFIETFECENVLIQDVKIINAPFWIIHPYRSNNVTINGVTVDSHGPNNDGCDPEYSKNVHIKNCTFNTGDDCIAIKSGRDHDGRRVNIKSENIVIQNCKMIDGHGGVVMGSEISSGVKNVFVENCVMDSPNLERAIRIKTNSRRGGTTENVYVRNLEIGQVRESVLKLNMKYATYEDQTGDYLPQIRNIDLQDIHVKDGGKYGILAIGLKKSPIKNITIQNLRIDQVVKPYALENAININFIDTYINGEPFNNIKL